MPDQAKHAQAMACLAIQGVDQYYGEAHMLHAVDLSVPQGQCTVLMGRNGVGKTTLMQVITGLLPVRGGSVSLNGEPLDKRSAEERAVAGIGYVPQGRQIFPLLTVQENLVIGLGARSDGARQVPDIVHELFPVLHEMRHRRGGDLSGGQQQQLAIGRALATDPSILLLDEPTEGIQPNIVAAIGDAIETLTNRYGISVLLVEQKLPFARRCGQRFALMDRGRIVADGAMADLSDSLVTEHLTV